MFMKKRPLKVIIGIIFIIISLVFFFDRALNIDFIFNKIVLNILMITLGSFLIYSFYGVENKTLKIYLMSMATFLLLIGLLPLVLELRFITLAYVPSITVPLGLYKLILLTGSAFVLIDCAWK